MTTKIEWTDETWNPVTGCTKVSPGCRNCYAERMWNRLSAPNMPYHGRKFTDVKCHPDRLDKPLHWKKPRKVFVNSMSDLFHEDVPDSFIDNVFAVMALAKQHTFQILTKRPERMFDYITEKWQPGREYDLRGVTIPKETEGETRIDQIEWACEEFIEKYNLCDPDISGHWDKNDSCIAAHLEWPLPNVWLGVSVENQETANERIPLLLETPAAARWISAEPLIGPVDFGGRRLEWLSPFQELDATMRKTPRLDWVVVGGESGPKARPMHPDWARSIRDQCVDAGVPLLFKQWGEYLYTGAGNFSKCGKKTAGRDLDGKLWDEYPCQET